MNLRSLLVQVSRFQDDRKKVVSIFFKLMYQQSFQQFQKKLVYKLLRKLKNKKEKNYYYLKFSRFIINQKRLYYFKKLQKNAHTCSELNEHARINTLQSLRGYRTSFEIKSQGLRRQLIHKPAPSLVITHIMTLVHVYVSR